MILFLNGNNLRWLKALVNCIQVLRVARTIKAFSFLRKLFSILINIIPQISNIAFVLFIFIITYSVIGVEFFAYLKPQKTIDNFHNFHDVLNSCINLIKSVTGESWYLILADCGRKMQPNFLCNYVYRYNDYKIHGNF